MQLHLQRLKRCARGAVDVPSESKALFVFPTNDDLHYLLHRFHNSFKPPWAAVHGMEERTADNICSYYNDHGTMIKNRTMLSPYGRG